MAVTPRSAARHPGVRVALVVVLLAAAWLLIAARDADAHKLSIARAKAAVAALARELARGDGLSSGRAENCSRVNVHKVRCDAVTQGFDSSVGAVATCTRHAVARYRPHKRGRKRQSKTVLVSVQSGYECKFDYGNSGGGGNGGGSGVQPPPAPDTVITAGPAEGSTIVGSSDFGPTYVYVSSEFSAVGGENPEFECSLDGQPFYPCSSGRVIRVDGAGPHTFSVRAVSYRGGAAPTPDPTPAERHFTLAEPPPPAAPDTQITSGPADGSTVVGQGAAGFVYATITFQFTAIGGESTDFECSIDGGPFHSCNSGAPQFYDGAGAHTFAVRAVSTRPGVADVPDPTPEQRSFTLAAP